MNRTDARGGDLALARYLTHSNLYGEVVSYCRHCGWSSEREPEMGRRSMIALHGDFHRARESGPVPRG